MLKATRVGQAGALMLSFGLCVSWARAQEAAALPAQLQDFDAYVEAVRKEFDVPGIAVAIVQDGKVVLERGYGVRELGKPAKVDQDTLFAIASNTKAFTATSLEMLVDEGKLSMDDRVIDHLPWFRMSDPYVTREMRIRDLLAHRSGLGLGAGDLLYWPTTSYSNREVAERLKDVPLTGGFRAQYAYDNILFGVAQLVIEQVSGVSYEQFLRTRILQPLGMSSTRFNSDFLKPNDNVATGHAKADFKDLQPAPRMTWSNVAGAGGIYSSVHDMGKWMNAQLAGGVYTDARGQQQKLFTPQRQRDMWSMVTPIPVSESKIETLKLAQPNYLGYGEGWMLSDYRGSKLVWHTGGWPGMVSRVTLVPEKKVGVVVLTSQEVGAAFNAVTLRALDAMLGAPQTDWLGAYAEAVKKQHDNADESWQKHVAARDASSRPSLPLDKYAGTLRDPWYGDVTIAREGDKLVLRFSKTAELVGDLSHWQHDTFVVRWRERWLNADAFLNFSLTPDGAIREARMEAISPLTDFSFDFQDLRLAPVAPVAKR
ncbi:CubicO group peptidase, beta-lactamase class C family [Pseudoxanthomonas indica]|uniref:CubicO group peptidase, beta-lactamase class C family n=2 Tax=Pseudoxanthomonas indica TaxID=428993 RepID=A0A1T5IRV2_9GAMM|nr:serine hydrolase [Pseudoxanthomonas indica]SKC41880.1 CubicO group peptidase, beta-lactamase class C family [Pseudoxanthomonas indica]